MTSSWASPFTRTVVPFNYAWRFHYGDDPTSPPESGPGTCSFETDLQDHLLCEGMEHNPNRFSEKDCRIACCYDPRCMAWQAFPIAKGRACYHGYLTANITCSPGSKRSGMGGGRRYSMPVPAFRTDYGFATADAASGVDAAWPVVDAPHDFIGATANFTDDDSNFKHGYLPRNASWYRKHFALPAAWQQDGLTTHVHFEGVFHHAAIFLNGRYLLSHECGYTGFTVRLDNVSSLRYGEGGANVNVLAVRVDASFGSGHWYEGGGIYRPVHLVRLSPLRIVHDGLFASPESDGAVVHASAEVELLGGRTAATARTHLAYVRFQLLDAGRVIATNVTSAVPVGSQSTILSTELRPRAGDVLPWSLQSPTLYTVRAEVLSFTNEGLTNEGLTDDAGDAMGAHGARSPPLVVDALERRLGFRTIEWTAGTDKTRKGGLYINRRLVELKGFSHHNSIGGLGVAIPERVNLLRVQASRALGANFWRQTHNPYTPHLYALLDTLGIMCWDENRDYGAKYLGGAYAVAFRDMVKRDRSHPSVVVWSFCNEFECEQADAAYSADAFRAAALGVDTSRALTANRVGDETLSQRLDVQGFSHKKNDSFIHFHQSSPHKPTVLSECCSCIDDGNQRMAADRGLPSCISDENTPAQLPFVAGSIGVWTLFDYFGEPHGTGTHEWPYVSSDFGQFDIVRARRRSRAPDLLHVHAHICMGEGVSIIRPLASATDHTSPFTLISHSHPTGWLPLRGGTWRGGTWPTGCRHNQSHLSRYAPLKHP